MTRIVYPGPGTEAYRSSKFAAEVNDTPAYVYGASRTTGHATQLWPAGVEREQSFFVYSTDETTTLEITRLAGAVTSAVVKPPGAAAQTIVAGKLQLTMPPNTRVRVECNGDRGETLHVQSAPLLPAVPGGAVSWPDYGVRAVASVDTSTNRFVFSTPHGWPDGSRVRIHSSNGVYPVHTSGTMSEGQFLWVVGSAGSDFQVSTSFGGPALDLTSAVGVGDLTFYRTTAPFQDLHFPAGDWRVGTRFLCRAGYNVYFDGSAHILGTWDVRSVTPVTFQGHGCLSGRVATWEAVVSDPVPWIMFHGRDDITFRYANVVDGPIVYGYPYFLTGFGVHTWRNVMAIAPWTYNADGFNTSKHPDGLTTSIVADCYAFVGDDALYMSADNWSVTCSNTYLSTCNGAPILFGYFYATISDTYEKRIENCWAQNYSLNKAGVPADPIIKCWVDAPVSFGWQGYSDVVVDNVLVMGQTANELLTFMNIPYPFGNQPSQAQQGQIMRMVFRNITMEAAPAKRSLITGLDAVNTPHDLLFENISFGGALLTAANFSTYFDVNQFPYNIYVDGIPVKPKVHSSGSWFQSNPFLAPFSYQPQPARLGNSQKLGGPLVWWPTGAVTPSRGAWKNAVAPADWTPTDTALAGTSAGTSSMIGSLTGQKTLAGISSGTSSMLGIIASRIALAGISSGTSSMTGAIGMLTPIGLAGASIGSSSMVGNLGSLLSLAGTSIGSSSMVGNLTGGGIGLTGTSAGTSSLYGNLGIIYSEANRPDISPMKQRIFNALLALCNNGPYYEAKVDAKSGQMTVFTSKSVKPVAVDVVELDKTFAPATRYRRAFNVAEIESWVFQVTLQFSSGLRVSCEQFENDVTDAGITIPQSKNVANQRTLLARLIKARYDEPPAQNPSLGSVVTFTFEVVPATLRK